MKVAELFEADWNHRGKTSKRIEKPFGNANYKPTYDSKTGHLKGHARDWLTLGDADLEDVKKAIAIVKDTPQFKELASHGLKYEGKPVREKAGSLYFVRQIPLHKLGLPDTSPEGLVKSALKAHKATATGHHSWHGSSLVNARKIIDAARIAGKDHPDFEAIEKSMGHNTHGNSYYIIYPNGQVRFSGDGEKRYSLLKSPKPRMVPGDPVKSLVKTYLGAIERMLELWKKSKDRKDTPPERVPGNWYPNR